MRTQRWLRTITPVGWAIAAMPLMVMPPVVAQTVVPDSTLGAESSTVTPDGVIRGVLSDLIEGGATRGSNLFHSFERFTIDAGRGVYFANPVGIENILSRVTGNSRSDIFGRLGVLGNANLFLLNPNGIVFGPNANLDIVGSFTATTANAIQLGDRGSFSATNPTNAAPLLTVSPSAYLFGQVPTGSIVNQSVDRGVGLQVRNGQRLTLLGGNVQINRGRLNAWEGRVEIGAVAGIAEIGINPNGSLLFPEGISRADILFTNNAVVDVRLNSGGYIGINGNNVNISFSNLAAGIDGLGFEGSQAGNVILNAAGNIQISSSQITNSTFGTGNAGDITLQANGSIRLNNNAGILSNVNAGAVGNGGNITINAESLLIDRSVIQSITRGGFAGISSGEGNSGNIIINLRGDLSISGSDAPSIIYGIVNSIDNGASGFAGDIRIVARDISMGNQTQIRSTLDALAIGAPGNIDVQARSLSMSNLTAIATVISGRKSGQSGNISIRTLEGTSLKDNALITSGVTSGGDGSSGNIYLEAGSLSVLDNAGLRTRVGIPVSGEGSENLLPAQGNAGNITLRIYGDAIFNNSVGGARSGIRSNVSTGSGTGGNIDVQSRSLLLSNGARFDSGTNTVRRAGDIRIDTKSLVLLNDSGVATTTSNSGDAGNLTVKTDQLILRGGSFLITDAFQGSSGRAGSLTVNATESIEISGTSPDLDASGIYAQARGTGDARDLQVTTKQLTILGGGALSAETSGSGNGGNLTVNASDFILIQGGSPNQSFSSSIGANTENSGNAGNVTINTKRLVARDGGFISSSSRPSATGDAGDVLINANESIEIIGRTLDQDNPSAIGVTGDTGNAGDLTINTGFLSVREGAAVLAQSLGIGQVGTINIHARDFVEVIGGATAPSTINATSQVLTTGQPGYIRIITNRLKLQNGGEITSTTFGPANASNIQIYATDSVEITGESPDGFGFGGVVARSVQFANTSGQGGNIDIQTGNLRLRDGGKISAATFGQGSAGNITLQVRDILDARNGNIETSSQQSSGGEIIISANKVKLFGDSDITTSVSFGAGGGGDITITANSIIAFDDSDILAFARDGRGGNVTLNTPAFFGQNYRPAPFGTDPLTLDGNDRVDINASGTVFGIITLPDVSFIQSSLTQLSQTAIDTNQLLATSCIVRRNQPNPSSFYITGPGGLPQRPGTPSSPTFPTGEIRNIAAETPNSLHTSHLTPHTSPSWQIGDPIQEPDGVYQLPNGELVLSHTCR